MASIEFRKVTKAFGNNVIIKDLNLKIEDGKFTVLVGPSGCGKTTLLRMIAGIGPQTSGEVLIDNTDVTNIAPGQRGIAMVFQNYAIYPTMTVRQNIDFGLRNNKVNKIERDALVQSVSEKVDLASLLDRKPGTLSGGQRQRIALARAMVKNPKVFLMDEPLSNLDAKLRVQMRVELIQLHKKLGTTFVNVTHDQVEAMSMADTIVLMNNGVIQQTGSPTEMYRNPDNLFAATFIGSPAMNIIDLGIDGIRFGFRPEYALLSPDPLNHFAVMKGFILTKEMLGSETLYQIGETPVGDGRRYATKMMGDASYQVDSSINVGVEEKNIYLFDAEGNRIRDNDKRYNSIMAAIKGGVYNQKEN